jgi:hypothetical protein
MITTPSTTSVWQNGAANVVTWTKGLLDNIHEFDVEIARLSQDGLIFVAKDGRYIFFPSSVPLLAKGVAFYPPPLSLYFQVANVLLRFSSTSITWKLLEHLPTRRSTSRRLLPPIPQFDTRHHVLYIFTLYNPCSWRNRIL